MEANPLEETTKACASCGKEFSGGETTCAYDGTTLTPIKKPGLTGTVAGKYEIVAALGGGGWGTVYKAKHMLLRRFVAIKTLHPHMVASGAALKRFKQEAQAGSQLDHPHILNVLDFGITDDGTPYLVMDYLEGQSLGDLLQSTGYLPVARGMRIFIQIASALAHAHRRGVIHRDLKPANIMLIEHDEEPDYVKIVDFGIAKILKREDSETESQLTETGQLFGSPLYMSPEQCTGKDLDGRSDIYSMGCVMYRTLSGQPPFEVNDLATCIYKHVNELPVSFCTACPDLKIPSEVEALVFKALSKEPAERFQSMGELEQAIQIWMEAQRLIAPDNGNDGNQTMLVPPVSTLRSPGVSEITKTPVIPYNNEVTVTPVPASLAKAADVTAQSTISSLESTAADTLPPVLLTQPANAQTPAPPAQDNAPAAAASAPSAQGKKGLLPLAMTPPIVAVLITVAVAALLILAHSLSRKGQVEDPIGSSTTPAATAEIQKGLDLFDIGEFDDSYKYFTDLIKNQGKDAPHDAMLWQAQSLIGLDRYAEAKPILLQYESQSGSQGNEVRALNALADAANAMGDRDAAQGYLNRALELHKNLTGSDRKEYANTLRAFGAMALRDKNYAASKKYLQEALSVCDQFEGRPIDRVRIYIDLGQAHQLLKEFSDARKCYNTAMEISKKLSPDSIATANGFVCLGTLDFNQNNYATSEQEFLKALKIERDAAGEENVGVAQIEFCLGVLKDKQGQFQQAANYMKQSLATRIKILGANDPETQHTKVLLEQIQKRTGSSGRSSRSYSRFDQLERKLGRRR